MKTEAAIKTVKELIRLIWGIEVEVSGRLSEQGILIELKPSEKDAPSIVGKEGANIMALRRLMKVWAGKNNCLVKIAPIIKK